MEKETKEVAQHSRLVGIWTGMCTMTETLHMLRHTLITNVSLSVRQALGAQASFPQTFLMLVGNTDLCFLAVVWLMHVWLIIEHSVSPAHTRL